MIKRQTPYGFLPGFIAGCASDWSGSGPTYTNWNIAHTEEESFRGWCNHGYCMIAGFVLQVSLIITTTIVALTVGDWAAMPFPVVIMALMFAQTIKASQLP